MCELQFAFSLCFGPFIRMLSPAGKSADSKRREEKTQLPPLKAKKSGWTCEVCMIPNDDSDAACAACSTPNPNSAPLKPLTNSLPAPENAFQMPKPGFDSKEKPTISFGDPSVKVAASKASPIPGFGTGKSDAAKIPAATVKFGLPTSSLAVR